VRSRLALAILPQLYTSTLNDDELTVVYLQQPELTRTIAMMRTISPLRSPLTEQCFQYLLQAFRNQIKTVDD